VSQQFVQTAIVSLTDLSIIFFGLNGKNEPGMGLGVLFRIEILNCNFSPKKHLLEPASRQWLFREHVNTGVTTYMVR
jgi:hypothetical protein